MTAGALTPFQNEEIGNPAGAKLTGNLATDGAGSLEATRRAGWRRRHGRSFRSGGRGTGLRLVRAPHGCVDRARHDPDPGAAACPGADLAEPPRRRGGRLPTTHRAI